MSTATAAVRLDGKEYVIVPRTEYDRLARLARAADLPPLPKPDADGNYPAVEYARASLARKLIRDRAELGLTQKQLAELAGVRLETLCRIERGRNTPSVATIAKIDRAIRKAVTPQGKGR